MTDEDKYELYCRYALACGNKADMKARVVYEDTVVEQSDGKTTLTKKRKEPTWYVCTGCLITLRERLEKDETVVEYEFTHL